MAHQERPNTAELSEEERINRSLNIFSSINPKDRNHFQLINRQVRMLISDGYFFKDLNEQTSFCAGLIQPFWPDHFNEYVIQWIGMTSSRNKLQVGGVIMSLLCAITGSMPNGAYVDSGNGYKVNFNESLFLLAKTGYNKSRLLNSIWVTPYKFCEAMGIETGRLDNAFNEVNLKRVVNQSPLKTLVVFADEGLSKIMELADKPNSSAHSTFRTNINELMNGVADSNEAKYLDGQQLRFNFYGVSQYKQSIQILLSEDSHDDAYSRKIDFYPLAYYVEGDFYGQLPKSLDFYSAFKMAQYSFHNMHDNGNTNVWRMSTGAKTLLDEFNAQQDKDDEEYLKRRMNEACGIANSQEIVENSASRRYDQKLCRLSTSIQCLNEYMDQVVKKQSFFVEKPFSHVISEESMRSAIVIHYKMIKQREVLSQSLDTLKDYATNKVSAKEADKNIRLARSDRNIAKDIMESKGFFVHSSQLVLKYRKYNVTQNEVIVMMENISRNFGEERFMGKNIKGIKSAVWFKVPSFWSDVAYLEENEVTAREYDANIFVDLTEKMEFYKGSYEWPDFVERIARSYPEFGIETRLFKSWRYNVRRSGGLRVDNLRALVPLADLSVLDENVIHKQNCYVRGMEKPSIDTKCRRIRKSMHLFNCYKRSLPAMHKLLVDSQIKSDKETLRNEKNDNRKEYLKKKLEQWYVEKEKEMNDQLSDINEAIDAQNNDLTILTNLLRDQTDAQTRLRQNSFSSASNRRRTMSGNDESIQTKRARTEFIASDTNRRQISLPIIPPGQESTVELILNTSDTDAQAVNFDDTIRKEPVDNGQSSKRSDETIKWSTCELILPESEQIQKKPSCLFVRSESAPTSVISKPTSLPTVDQWDFAQVERSTTVTTDTGDVSEEHLNEFRTILANALKIQSTTDSGQPRRGFVNLKQLRNKNLNEEKKFKDLGDED